MTEGYVMAKLSVARTAVIGYSKRLRSSTLAQANAVLVGLESYIGARKGQHVHCIYFLMGEKITLRFHEPRFDNASLPLIGHSPSTIQLTILTILLVISYFHSGARYVVSGLAFLFLALQDPGPRGSMASKPLFLCTVLWNWG